MATTIFTPESFLESLESFLVTATTCDDTASASFDKAIRHSLGLADGAGAGLVFPSTRDRALLIMRPVIESWRTLLPNDDLPISKLDLGYSAVRNTDVGGGEVATLRCNILDCFTASLHTVQGASVPEALVRNILKAASKWYLLLNNIHYEHAPIIAAPLAYSTWRAKKYPFAKLAFQSLDDNALLPRTPNAELLQPGDSGYDPDYPTFRDPSTFRVAAARNSKGPGAINNLLQPRMDGPTDEPMQKGRGNHGHDTLVPWLQDELDFITTLIIVYQNSLTWQELADATNEVFQHRPVMVSGGLVQRGNRHIAGIRQHKLIKEMPQLLPLLDAQTDPKQPAVVVDWKLEYQRMKAAEDDGEGGHGDEYRVFIVIIRPPEHSANSWQDVDSDQYAQADGDEMMRREAAGSVLRGEEDGSGVEPVEGEDMTGDLGAGEADLSGEAEGVREGMPNGIEGMYRDQFGWWWKA
ncbi:hypothetical protein LTR62_002712 [Meristemomyces frigidus]|uniref:Uncharacterized protein n=1 Tax=Meristemomyces frigidus TaxID=1508187 RepID=A0AAN7TSK0_9PEZI|nr:hypothetical protein LTR62_002712 [Meristemomyces frigidus]